MEFISDIQNEKYNRINRIIALLKTRGYTISELAELLGVSAKTISRDLQILSHQGATRKGRTWSMGEAQTSSDERLVIGVLDDVARGMGAQFYHKAHVVLKQLSSGLGEQFVVNIDSEKLDEKDFDNFVLIERAIKQSVKILCEYKSRKHLVEPLRLAFLEGFWYLMLIDEDGKFKKFHLRSFEKLTLTNEHFEADEKLIERLENVRTAWFEPENKYVARLLLSPYVVKYFLRRPLPTQRVTGKDPDGSVEIEVDFTNEMELKPLIYYYIPHIKVLEPKWFADLIKEETAEYAKDISEITKPKKAFQI